MSSPTEQKPAGAMEHIEQIHTNERVPGHENYYEKNGLRTYGDDGDHDSAPKMSFKRMMSLIAMAFCTCFSLWIQIATDSRPQCGQDPKSRCTSLAASRLTFTATLAVLIAGSGSSWPTFFPSLQSARLLVRSQTSSAGAGSH